MNASMHISGFIAIIKICCTYQQTVSELLIIKEQTRTKVAHFRNEERRRTLY